MELKSDKRPFKLKSSPIQIMFIPFNQNDDECFSCGNEYTETLIFEQKYCEKCFLDYINEITDNCTYLDLHISTKWFIQCNEHEPSRNEEFYTRNIKEWCEHCSIISYFKQIPSNSSADTNPDFERKEEVIGNEKDCKLCGNLIYSTSLSCDLKNLKLKMCSDCYQISYDLIESTSTKESIPILHLPWWDAFYECMICKVKLIIEYMNQKWCPHCFIIYSGCRYCLTTNIIFGYTNKSQCKKCRRTLSIIMNKTNISIGNNNEIDDFLYNTRNIINVNYMKDIDKDGDIPLNVYSYLKEKIYKRFNPEAVMEWIPHSRIKNLEEIAQGGFGSIYRATWLDGGINSAEYSSCYRIENETIAVKRFFNSQDISEYFLDEVKSHHKCYKFERVIRCYGITKSTETNEYMLVMNFADGGNLHNFLQKNFTKITWEEKLDILWQISYGLETIHNAEFIHGDFHSGNILLVKSYRKWETGQWQIGDLGLSRPVNNITLNDKRYGVMPYLAPEILNGAEFSKSSDVYSMSMIMWEITAGCRPFSNIKHDIHFAYKIIDKRRPEITDDTPECLVNLMKKCWDPNPTERPSITKIRETFSLWYDEQECVNQFIQAEEKRLELIKSKKFGPNFTKKPQSIVVVRISKSSSNNSTSTEEYISKECELDINDIQCSTIQNFISTQLPVAFNNGQSSRKRNIEELYTETQEYKYISNEYELDINDIQCSPVQNFISTQQSVAFASGNRNIEELNTETQEYKKRIKTEDN